MNIGIDLIGFYAPSLYIELTDLATYRQIDPNKLLIGLGQTQMAICPLTQDAISMAANASLPILTKTDLKAIDLVIFTTESGVDYSKSAATYIHGLLGINPRARAIEMKHACYSATAAIQLARGHIALHPDKKVLILASDISRYGLNVGAESTQGAGAIALLMSQNPRLLVIEPEASYHTEHIYDFWKPNYSDVALVDGPFSNQKYQEFFHHVYQDYLKISNRTIEDFAGICFHIPYTKIGYKTLRTIANEEKHAQLFANYQLATTYNKQVGNIYTGALYLNLLSLLERGNLKTGERIGLFSYGSGAVAEFFSVLVQPNYQKYLNQSAHEEMLKNRRQLSIPDYERIFATVVQNGENLDPADTLDTGHFYFEGIRSHQRIYRKKQETNKD